MIAESSTPLTDDEKVALNAGTSLFGWALHADAFAALVPVVESILLARETALRERLARVWEQGQAAGLNDAQLGPDDDGYTDNPYRGQA